jgi:PAS domain S-box-containing protein
LKTADELLGWDSCYINFYSPEDNAVYDLVTIDTIDGEHREVPPAYIGPHINLVAERTIREGSQLILRDPSSPPMNEDKLVPFGDKSRRSASLLFAPIRKGEKTVGVISLQSYELYAYNNDDLDVLQILADHCSGALDRTLTEEKLFQDEEKLRLLTEQIPALLWTTDKDLRFTLLRGAGLKSLHLVGSQLIGKTLFDFFQTSDQSSEPVAMHKQALKGKSSHYEMSRMGIFFDSYVEPLQDVEGRIIGCICVAHDVSERKIAETELRKARDGLERRVEERTRELTRSNALLRKQIVERKRAEEKLARSEAIYREAIENASGVPYRLVYADNNYDFVGEGINTLIGYSSKEFNFDVLKENVLEIKIVDPDAPFDHLEYVKAFKRGEVDQYRVDLRMNTRTGEEKWISDCSVPVRDEKTGEVIGSLGILQDITKRKKVEEQARIQREQLIHADKMVALGTLVSGVAHEINNPNNFIMLNTPVLSEAWESIKPIMERYYKEEGDFLMGGLNYSEMRDHVPVLFSGILDGCKRIKNIVQELRDFARRHPAELKEEVDINEVVNSALTLVSNMVKKSTEHFTVEFGTNIPKLKGNFQRLEQVVINLIQNSCQSLPDRDKNITVSTNFNEENRVIVIKVKDEGAGIPQEELKHIMDPFFTTKRDSGGTGLGLSISSTIVDEHGGTLEIISQVGTGTEAIVTLPV